MNQIEALNILINAVQVAFNKAPGVYTMPEVRIIQNAIDVFTTPQQQSEPQVEPAQTPFVSQAQTIQHRNEDEQQREE